MTTDPETQEVLFNEDKLTTCLKEFKYIGKTSVPAIITFFLQYSLTAVTIFSVSHIGKNELAAVSLATMTFNITLAVFIGMSTCLDTLCSQAYGAGNFKLVGLHWQRCTTMILCIAIPAFPIYWFAGPILGLFISNKILTDLAQSYLRTISFGLPGYILFETGKRFLQAQGIFQAPQYVLFICTPLNIFLNYLLVWNKRFGIGFCGAPLATAINYWGMCSLLFLYVVFVEGRECWFGFKLKNSFDNWGMMLSLALPGVIMTAAEFFAFEILTICASRFGTDALASQSIVSTIASLTFQIPYGIAVATATRIATYVGSRSSQNAKIAIKVAMIISAVNGVLTCTLILIFQQKIVSLFTNEPQVIRLVLSVMKILAVNQLYDSINVVASGCLRGQGRQKIGGNLNLVSYYIIGIPLALFLAFAKDNQLQGLWTGLGIGIFILAMSEIWLLFNGVDWDKILDDATERNNLVC